MHELTPAQIKYQRRRLFFARPDEILAAFRGEIRFEGVGFDLPDDAEVVGVHEDWYRRTLAVMIRSDSFDVVPDGGLPPEMGMIRVLPVVKGTDSDGAASDSVKSWRDTPML